jgi:hypothetical protein
MCFDGVGTPRDCGVVFECFNVCVCDASGCTSRRTFSQTELQVDGALDADGRTLVGTLLLPDSRTIHLERQ